MKTAEDLTKDFVAGFMSAHTEDYVINSIKQIQLDAMKEGARRAAEVCVQYKNYGDLHPPINTRNAILALVENLTLNDL